MREIQNLRELMDIARAVTNKIAGEKKVSLRVECMNGLAIYESYIHVDNKFSKFVERLRHGCIELDASNIYSVKVTCIDPQPKVIKDNVRREGDKLILDLKPALSYNLIQIEIAYHMDEDFLNSLVRWRSSPEPLVDKMRYKLSAQLRNPEALILGFTEVEIEEFPITTTIHIKERIDAGIPEYVKRLFKVESEIMEERDPHAFKKIMKLQQEKAKLLKRLGKKTSLMEKIQALASLLTPTNFRKYIDVFEDFRFHECERGSQFFKALGTLTLPRSMDVISRADLDLKKPAAKGTLVYEAKQFENDIRSLF